MQPIYRIGKSSFEYKNRRTHGEKFPYIPHFHNSYEIFYFLEGEGSYAVEGKQYPLSPGDIIITNPRELHAPLITSDVYHRITLSIHPLYLSAFITKDYNPFNGLSSRSLADQNRIPADIVHQYGLDKEIEALGTFSESTNPCRDAMITAHLLILLESINQIINVPKLSFANERIREIVHYINVHLTEKITLASLAETFFINRHHLSHTFHDRMGMTLTDYITSKRVQKSLELLSEPMSLLDVALAVGFSDYASFYRAFIKIVGTSPQVHRKSISGSRFINQTQIKEN